MSSMTAEWCPSFQLWMRCTRLQTVMPRPTAAKVSSPLQASAVILAGNCMGKEVCLVLPASTGVVILQHYRVMDILCYVGAGRGRSFVIHLNTTCLLYNSQRLHSVSIQKKENALHGDNAGSWVDEGADHLGTHEGEGEFGTIVHLP